MENLNTSEISNLLFLVSKIRKESSDIALNDYYQAMSKHDVFCKTLGISDTPFASDRLSRLKASGLVPFTNLSLQRSDFFQPIQPIFPICRLLLKRAGT